MRTTSLRAVVERTRPGPDWDFHLRNFLDEFYALHGDRPAQSAFIAEDPGFVGDARIDAFVGAVGEHLARRWNLPIPTWVRNEARYLDAAMFQPDEKPLRGYLLGASPVAFRTRLIFVGAEPLQRARFPYVDGVRTLPRDFPAAS